MSSKFDHFSPSAKMVFAIAGYAAELMNHRNIEEHHVLLGLLIEKHGVGRLTLRKLGVSPVQLVSSIQPTAPAMPDPNLWLALGSSTKQLIKRSIEEARRLKQSYVGTGHLLLAVLYQKAKITLAALEAAHTSLQEADALTRQMMAGGVHPKDIAHPPRRSLGRTVGSFLKQLSSAGSQKSIGPVSTQTPQKSNFIRYVFSEFPALYPLTAEDQLYFADLCAVRQQFNLAVNSYNNSIGLNPDLAAADYGRGRVRFWQKQYSSAIKHFNKAIQLNPNFTDGYYSRGQAHFWKADYDKAIADYNETIRLSPSFSGVYRERGIAYFYKKDYASAIADFDELLRRIPNDEIGYINRSAAYLSEKNYDAAIRDASAAIRLSSKFPEVYLNRGIAWEGKGEFEEAIRDFSEAIRLDPRNVQPYLRRASAYFRENELDRVIEDCNVVLSINPENRAALHTRGTARTDKKDYDGAESDFRERLRLYPDNSYSHSNLGWLNLLRGNYDAAIEFCERALQIDAKNGSAYYSRGTARAAKGDHEGAVADYRQSLIFWTGIHTKHSEHYFQEMQTYIDQWGGK